MQVESRTTGWPCSRASSFFRRRSTRDRSSASACSLRSRFGRSTETVDCAVDLDLLPRRRYHFVDAGASHLEAVEPGQVIGHLTQHAIGGGLDGAMALAELAWATCSTAETTAGTAMNASRTETRFNILVAGCKTRTAPRVALASRAVPSDQRGIARDRDGCFAGRGEGDRLAKPGRR